jgi:membrane protease subunit HflK|tara:strand:+ start:420 stop:1418 length:999 start_codon:yes stop_codon:yes gene_type:complete
MNQPDIPDILEELSNIDLSKYRGIMQVAVILVVLCLTAYTSVFTVDPEEKAVVLKFGKYDRMVDQGLHFKLPFYMEQEYKVPVQRQLKLEFGFRTAGNETRQQYEQTQYSDDSYASESLMLTGDLNVASIEWVTQYKIADPVKYLFKVRNVDQTFRDMNEAVLREIIGDRTINEVLTVGRGEIQNLAKDKLSKLCEDYTLGIVVSQVILQDVSPPDAVKPAFNEVNQAEQEKETTIQNALATYNKEIPKAEGTALRTVEAAEGYAVKRVNEAKGAVSRFTQVFEEYTKAPEITRQRIYLETMSEIYQAVDRKIIIDESATGILPLLNLGQER